MKTLILKLTNQEYEALNRLAFINKTTKNKLLTTLLIDEYFEHDADCIAQIGALIDISEGEFFAESLTDALKESGSLTDPDAHSKILRAFDYSMSQAKNELSKVRLIHAKNKTISKWYKTPAEVEGIKHG